MPGSLKEPLRSAADRRLDKSHLIDVLSAAGIEILPMMGAYATTKNALSTATEALRQERVGTCV